MFIAAAHSSPPLTAHQIIEKSIEARGKLTVDGEIAIRVSGKKTCNKEAMSYYSIIFDNKYYYESTIQNDGGNISKFVSVSDGTEFWEQANGAPQVISDELRKCLTQMASRTEICELDAIIATKKYQLARLPEMKVDGEPCVGVRVSTPNLPDTDLFFDKSSNLLRRMSGVKLGPDGKKYDIIVVDTDYKRFSGRLYSTRLVTTVDDRMDHVIQIESVIERVEVVPLKDVKIMFGKP